MLLSLKSPVPRLGMRLRWNLVPPSVSFWMSRETVPK